jgi:uncharacterized protein YegL
MASRNPKNPKKSPKSTHTAATSKNACAALPDHLQKEWFDLSPATAVARRTMCQWRCANGHTWTDTKEHRLRGAGCPACAAANGKSPQQKIEQSSAVPTAAPAQVPTAPLGENQVMLVVDTSGSMASGGYGSQMRPDAVSALNSIVSEIKNLAKSTGIPTKIRLVQFSNVVNGGGSIPVESFEVPKLFCGGVTVLRDAIANAIGDTKIGKATDGGPVTKLVMVLTDGEENGSRNISPQALTELVKRAQATDMYTVAMLVPKGSELRAHSLTGVPIGNVRGWDVASATGAADAGQAASSAVAGYYDSRSKGVTRSTRFFVDASKISEADVLRTAKPLTAAKVWRIEKEMVIKDAVESRGYEFREGCGYYELSKGERLRAGRAILLQSRSNTRAPVYAGEGLRQLLGIPDGEHLIGEGALGDWRVYVQSTSFNRKLVRGTLFIYRTDGDNGGVGYTWRPDANKFNELLASRNGENSYLVSHDVAAGLHIGSLVKIGGIIREVSDIQSDRQMVNARVTAAPWVAPK